jgi:hypothetical protein
MIPFIKDLENYKDTLIKNCVFKLLVWDDTKDMYIPYVGRKTFQKETKVEKLFKYRGSTKGNNKANPKILEAMRKSSKPSYYEIVVHNVPAHDLGYHEQRAIMMIDFPLGGHKSDNCFNERFPIDGISEKSMRSVIALDMLREKIRKDKDPNDKFSFPTGFSTRDRIKYLKENNLFVQCRLEIQGSETNIDYFKEKMQENPNPDEWNGDLWLLMPKYKDEDERILDGNQGGESCIRVPDMPGLNDKRVPYEDHEHIVEEDLETLGIELNEPSEDRLSGNSPFDIERNVKNKIIKHNLFTKKGIPIIDHQLVNDIFKKVYRSDTEIKRIKNSVKLFFEKKQKDELRRQQGLFDFHEKALKKNDGDNGNKRKWDELLKPIKFDKYCKKHQFTFGMEEKIPKNIIAYKKSEKKWPQKLLSICTFMFEDRYHESKKDTQFWKDVIFQQSAVCDVTIILVNPTGEEYHIIK